MDVVELSADLLAQAAELFAADVRGLRDRVPALPPTCAAPVEVAALQAGVLQPGSSLAAVDRGRLVGYLGWWLIDDFRGTGRRAAYSPVHANHVGSAAHSALYGAAAERWTDAGCEAHALTLLAGRPNLERLWFERGFGALVADGIRATRPVDAPAVEGLVLRAARPDDAADLAALDVEHCAHYSAPPVLMAPRKPTPAGVFADLLGSDPDAVWVADGPQGLAAFLRFDLAAGDVLVLARGPSTVAINGAFTRPAWRGKGAAAALLGAATARFAERGMTRMAVDYEMVNPPAAAFWPRWFDIVATSVMRIPEHRGGPHGE